ILAIAWQIFAGRFSPNPGRFLQVCCRFSPVLAGFLLGRFSQLLATFLHFRRILDCLARRGQLDIATFDGCEPAVHAAFDLVADRTVGLVRVDVLTKVFDQALARAHARPVGPLVGRGLHRASTQVPLGFVWSSAPPPHERQLLAVGQSWKCPDLRRRSGGIRALVIAHDAPVMTQSGVCPIGLTSAAYGQLWLAVTVAVRLSSLSRIDCVSPTPRFDVEAHGLSPWASVFSTLAKTTLATVRFTLYNRRSDCRKVRRTIEHDLRESSAVSGFAVVFDGGHSRHSRWGARPQSMRPGGWVGQVSLASSALAHFSPRARPL